MRIGSAALVVLGVLAAAPAAAQAGAPASAPARADSSHGPPARFFNRRDAVVAAGFAATTVAMFPLDTRIATELQDSTTQASRFLHNAARGFNTLGDPGAIAISFSAYAIGRLAHQDRLADIGLHTTESIVFASAVTGLVKGAAGRARPYLHVHRANDFRFAGGFGSNARSSFPSGHTTAAFAAASAVTEELAHSRPGSQWVVGPVLYGAAALVGGARMYDNKHWASDVVLGAAVGTFSGWKIVVYNHAHPGNRLDHALLRPTVGASPSGGLALGFTLPGR
jgi:membrane-associated phospholipid phosphatase